MSSIRLVGKCGKLVLRNLIFALAFLVILSSASIISISAYAISTNQREISPLKVHYPITVNSSNPIEYGYFGDTVAISGKLAIVGAPHETVDGYSEAGHAYIFNTKTGSTVTTLTSPNAQDDGYFGDSVAISGNLVIVGADGETADGYNFAGNAYVFNANTGDLIATLTSPNLQWGVEFGFSVAISGKLAIIGAPGETVDGYSDAGQAYAFNADTGSLISILTSQNVQNYGDFGFSVAISGKVAMVGAVQETADGQSLAGHAYVFNANTGTLITSLTSPNAQYEGEFGFSVAVSGSVAIVGAPHETADGYSDAGHAYIFNAETGSLICNLTSPNAQDYGAFGLSVAISGKLAIVGAEFETAYYSDAGHAYIFNAETGSLVATLTSPNAQYDGYLGQSAGISGKLAIVGAPGETADGYSDAGHAYIFKE